MDVVDVLRSKIDSSEIRWIGKLVSKLSILTN
jgi:hypothetical protein